MTTHPLDGTAWRLVAYRSGDQLVDLPQDATVTLRFDLPDVGGKSAVNQYHGMVEFKPDTSDSGEGRLAFIGFASTMMAGPEHLMAVEALYLDLLQKAERWSKENEHLMLQDASGEVALRFERDV
jgi:heat shock protein HslJ